MNANDSSPKPIVVAGDVCIDWVLFPSGGPVCECPRRNWQLREPAHMHALSGGAILTAELVRAATGSEVRGHVLREPIASIPPTEVLHSQLEVARFPSRAGEKNNDIVRVQRFLGFSGPVDGYLPAQPVDRDDSTARVVVLDDVGNGFRSQEPSWPKAIQSGVPDWIICKTCSPLFEGELWERLRARCADRLILIVSADDLRAKGAYINRRLSWEQTTGDLIWELHHNPVFRPLLVCQRVVIRLGNEGAVSLHVDNGRITASTLHYVPDGIEESFGDSFPGAMTGFGSVFVAAVAKEVSKAGASGLPRGIADGIQAQWRLLAKGFLLKDGKPAYPLAPLFAAPEKDEKLPQVSTVEMPNDLHLQRRHESAWRILHSLATKPLREIAEATVIGGLEAALPHAPVGRFGALETADRIEIEGYRAVRNLIREYLDPSRGKPERPLSIAVFGPPGSGKSFGVEEVARSAAFGVEIEKLTFNLSQYQNPKQIVAALHSVRDSVVRGKVPLVFFDEFDARFGADELGWLKFFLAPMQDGVFTDGQATHLIGRAIFVFAGGTHNSFRDFSEACERDPARSVFFKAAKLPDFVSRLRGYVDILGTDHRGERDGIHVLRRAVVLRSLIVRRTKWLMRRSRAVIAPGVLRALLTIPQYKHGARSIESIIDMSQLGGRTEFDEAALPSAQQLDLHVQGRVLLRLTDARLADALEKVAQELHEDYRRKQLDEIEKAIEEGKPPAKSPDDPALRAWADLPEPFKTSNRRQAEHILIKLDLIHCDCRIAFPGESAPLFAFKDGKEIELLARAEHDRWWQERLEEGWRPGDRDPLRKTSPYLVPWEQLEAGVRDWDLNFINVIPAALQNAGFVVYRTA